MHLGEETGENVVDNKGRSEEGNEFVEEGETEDVEGTERPRTERRRQRGNNACLSFREAEAGDDEWLQSNKE